MRIYVAAKTHDFERARKVMDLCQELGHEITFDWTQNVEQFGPSHENEAALSDQILRRAAEDDVLGVKRSQLLIGLGHPRVCGTLIEIGMTIRQGTPIILVGEFPPSVFWHLPQITKLDHERYLRGELEKRSIGGK